MKACFSITRDGKEITLTEDELYAAFKAQEREFDEEFISECLESKTAGNCDVDYSEMKAKAPVEFAALVCASAAEFRHLVLKGWDDNSETADEAVRLGTNFIEEQESVANFRDSRRWFPVERS